MPSKTILIVDDDKSIVQTTTEQLNMLGYKSDTAYSGAEANRLLDANRYGLILLDFRLPDTDGITLCKNWRESHPQTPIILVSGSAAIPDAVAALKYGAVDFLVKPVDLDVFEAVLSRTLSNASIKRENVRLRELLKSDSVEFLGKSGTVQQLLSFAEKMADSDHPILLEGETGTGKQVLARHIHSHSPAASEPFVQVNCAAITPTLFESEIFGHEKGSFTGAMSKKIGKMELVGKGTLFLDEIGELPETCQAKLLTAVEDRLYERVGGNAQQKFAGRIVAATNRNLDNEVSEKRFRQDLFFRLNTLRLKLPVLRERAEDIPIYVESTLTHISRKRGVDFKKPSSLIYAKLGEYHWPGNVRELIHHVERIAILADGDNIPEDLWLSFPGNESNSGNIINENDLKLAVEEFKKLHIDRILDSCGGNQTEAAKLLGIGRSHLNRIIANFREDK
jgi:DNA-binding NtrC family response regulator